MPLSTAIKQVLRRVGIEARRYGVQTSSDAQLGQILKHLGVDLVLDVGAHEGQYGLRLRALGYRGRIVSFEPLYRPYVRLVEASRRDPRWEVAPRTALGETDGVVTVRVSAHSLSSSILEMLPLHEDAVPGSGIIGSESTPLARLDGIALPYILGAKVIFLKIDTQGYEDRVLAGAREILERVAAIQIELSLVPLYAGQPLWDAMRNMLENMGFELFALFPGHAHASTGRTLQVDGLFVRCSPSGSKTWNSPAPSPH